MKVLKIVLAAVLAFAFSVPAGVAIAEEGRRQERQHYQESEFYGLIESMPGKGFEGTWVIDGREVKVNTNTRIKEKRGQAVKGAYVEVKGQQSGDIFTAYKIEVENKTGSAKSAYPAKFYGVVESIPQSGLNGTWTVNGRDIVVTGDTRVKEKYGKLAAGAYVEVKGDFSGKEFIAYEIEVKGDRRRMGLDNNFKKGRDRGMMRPGAAKEKFFNSKFSGVIESMPETGYEGIWMIGGKKVEVINRTLIDETAGSVSKGADVKVKGIRQGDVITAHEIEITGKK